MEILTIQKWIENCSGSGDGFGYGSGDGSGSGSGDGFGYGSGSGSGFGFGSGDGSGSGSGSGSGFGSGSGSGSGSGFGFGSGSGDGSGSGEDIKLFCGSPVFLIDRIPTIITAVFGSCAKGYILKPSLTLTPCYIANKESHFAHGETLGEAVAAVAEKAFDDMPEEERIDEFWKCHQKGVKYPAKDFYEWHHKLTGSCEMGRKNFAAEHGIDLTKDEFTVDEFIKLCCNSYGGEVISKLLEAEK